MYMCVSTPRPKTKTCLPEGDVLVAVVHEVVVGGARDPVLQLRQLDRQGVPVM